MEWVMTFEAFLEHDLVRAIAGMAVVFLLAVWAETEGRW